MAVALRGPLPLGTGPADGDDAGGGAGMLGRGVVARCLAAAPFAAGEAWQTLPLRHRHAFEPSFIGLQSS